MLSARRARRKRDCEGLISLCTIGMLQRSKRKKHKLEKRLIEVAEFAKAVPLKCALIR